MSRELTIIIPVYNEAENLNRLKTELLDFFKVAKIKSSALLINDGSTDDSSNLIKQICSENSNFSCIEFDKNYGISTALKAGINHIETDFIGYIDADLQTDPQDFNLLLEHIDSYNLVTGYRKNRKDSFTKKLGSKIANKVRRLFTNDGMYDTGCPLKIIRTENAKRIPFFKGLHRFLPAMILLQKGNVKQVSVRHYPRVGGQSKFGILNRVGNTFVDCLAFLWMKKRYINYKVKKTTD
jgi:glycosyltransferase involved in cell wall biosynthesis